MNTPLTQELGLDYLGLDYMLTHARRWVKPGDTIILPLEYQLYLADSRSDPKNAESHSQ